MCSDNVPIRENENIKGCSWQLLYSFFPFTNSVFFNFRVERRREDPDLPKESQLTTLPRRVPIDWFDPDYWNYTLTVHERTEYLQQGGRIRIALPEEEFCDTLENCLAWKNLPENEFMEQYGNAVLAYYNIPTPEEIEQLGQWDSEQHQTDDEEIQIQEELFLHDDEPNHGALPAEFNDNPPMDDDIY